MENPKSIVGFVKYLIYFKVDGMEWAEEWLRMIMKV
jgi:hypothetical protein